MLKPYDITIILVGSKDGSRGYHVFRNDRLVFRMCLTIAQQIELDVDTLCGVNPIDLPQNITIINPFCKECLSTTVKTVDEAKLVMKKAFQDQRYMFSND